MADFPLQLLDLEHILILSIKLSTDEKEAETRHSIFQAINFVSFDRSKAKSKTKWPRVNGPFGAPRFYRNQIYIIRFVLCINSFFCTNIQLFSSRCWFQNKFHFIKPWILHSPQHYKINFFKCKLKTITNAHPVWNYTFFLSDAKLFYFWFLLIFMRHDGRVVTSSLGVDWSRFESWISLSLSLFKFYIIVPSTLILEAVWFSRETTSFFW